MVQATVADGGRSARSGSICDRGAMGVGPAGSTAAACSQCPKEGEPAPRAIVPAIPGIDFPGDRLFGMSDTRNVGGTDRLLRAVLAVVLSVVAVRTLADGNRTLGTVAALGALGAGFNAVTGFCGLNETLGIDTTTD